MDGGRKSLEFPYHGNTFDEGLRAGFRACSNHCRHDAGQVVGFHPTCQAAISVHWSMALRQATAFSFRMTPSEEEKRRRALLGMLANGLDLSGILPPKTVLPDEIKRMIAAYLVCEYAAHSIGHLWSKRQKHQSSVCVVDTSRSIWARSVTIEGEDYLCNLTNANDNQLIQISDPAGRRIDVIYLLQDHLGIKKAVFASDDSKGLPTAMQGHWWEAITSPKLLRLASDVGRPAIHGGSTS